MMVLDVTKDEQKFVNFLVRSTNLARTLKIGIEYKE
jgi:hypothetical protein